MRICKIDTHTNPDRGDFLFPAETPITVFSGRDADVQLCCLQMLIGDYSRYGLVENTAYANCLLHADVEMDGKNYAVCYIGETDGAYRIGVNFPACDLHPSMADTEEYLDKVQTRVNGDTNVFSLQACNRNDLPESRRLTHGLDVFLKIARKESEPGDDRPLFIYDFFNRIDEAEPLTPWLDELAVLGRQVFISVGENYPTEKLSHPSVQIIRTNS